jgi:hypothetical protein
MAHIGASGDLSFIELIGTSTALLQRVFSSATPFRLTADYTPQGNSVDD